MNVFVIVKLFGIDIPTILPEQLVTEPALHDISLFV